MTQTQDFHEITELPNVEGVSYDADGVVTAFVTKKVPITHLDSEDVVSNHSAVSGHETDVVDLGGEITAHPTEWIQNVNPEDLTDERQKHRPVVGGTSEMLLEKQQYMATGGPLVHVDSIDGSNSLYGTNVSEGDICRLSNCHVYADMGDANFGDAVTQPSPPNGGTQNDVVGELCAYVPVTDGMNVDASLRTTDSEESYDMVHGSVNGVKRDGLGDMKGDTLTVLGGARTGIDSAEVIATSVDVRVNYDSHGTIKVTDCIATKKMTAAGDSGAPIKYDPTNELVALNFAGSSKVTIVCKIANVEDALGVTALTEAPTNDTPNPSPTPSPTPNPTPSPNPGPPKPVWNTLGSLTIDGYEYRLERREAE